MLVQTFRVARHSPAVVPDVPIVPFDQVATLPLVLHCFSVVTFWESRGWVFGRQAHTPKHACELNLRAAAQ